MANERRIFTLSLRILRDLTIGVFLFIAGALRWILPNLIGATPLTIQYVLSHNSLSLALAIIPTPVGIETLLSPAAGGYIQLWLVDPNVEKRHIECLEPKRNTLVVWIPNDVSIFYKLKYLAIENAVRRVYRPYIRFGQIEIWVRPDELKPVTHLGAGRE